MSRGSGGAPFNITDVVSPEDARTIGGMIRRAMTEARTPNIKRLTLQHREQPEVLPGFAVLWVVVSLAAI